MTEKVCQVKMHDNRICGRPLYENEDVCICHSNDPQKNTKLFDEELRNILSASDIGLIDFTGFIFTSFSGFFNFDLMLPVYFDKCIFHIEPDFSEVEFFQTVSFDNTSFNKGANFSKASFGQGVMFLNCKIEGDFNFSNATFGGMNRFYDLNIWGRFKMTRVTVLGSLMIEKLKNVIDIDLYGATVNKNSKVVVASLKCDEIYLSGSKIIGEVDLANVNSNKLFLVEVNLHGILKIEYISVEKLRLTSCNFFGGSQVKVCGDASIKEKYEYSTYFGKNIVSEESKVELSSLSLNYWSFEQTDVTKIKFNKIQWPVRYSMAGHILRYIPKLNNWMIKKKILCKYMIYDEIYLNSIKYKGSYGDIASIYRQLQDNYSSKYDYGTAGDFYIGEQYVLNKSRSLWDVHKLLSKLYFGFSQYGESYIRPFMGILVIVLILPIAFYCSGIEIDGNIYTFKLGLSGKIIFLDQDYWLIFFANLSDLVFKKGIIESVKFSDFQHGFIVIEFIVLLILITLFLLALRRQFKRKSF